MERSVHVTSIFFSGTARVHATPQSVFGPIDANDPAPLCSDRGWGVWHPTLKARGSRDGVPFPARPEAQGARRIFTRASA
eukprot:1108705-Pyramimonas_sp.AAC.2